MSTLSLLASQPSPRSPGCPPAGDALLEEIGDERDIEAGTPAAPTPLDTVKPVVYFVRQLSTGGIALGQPGVSGLAKPVKQVVRNQHRRTGYQDGIEHFRGGCLQQGAEGGDGPPAPLSGWPSRVPVAEDFS